MADPTPLADDSDVVAVLGRALTSEEAAKVAAILLKASELFREASGQLFTPGTSTVRLKSNGGLLYLEQRPVTAVSSVVDDDGLPVSYRRWPEGSQWLETCLRSHEFAVVTYDHGDDEVPALVRTTIAEIAKKVLLIPEDAAVGVQSTSQTKGPFTDSITYATWAQGGQTMLSPSDTAIARKFRRRPPKVTVMRSETGSNRGW